MLPTVRRRLADNSRDLRWNSPFFSALFDRLDVYVIGNGIWPLTESGDPVLNQECDAAFMETANDIDIRGGISWPMLQSQLYLSEGSDGDSGCILTRDNIGEPKVWATEGYHIGDPYAPQGSDWFDGVQLGTRGQRLAYRVTSEDHRGFRSHVDVDAENFVHQYDPKRCGQTRGIPLLTPALDTMRDVQEIINLEKLAVKDASSKTDIITLGGGEMNTDDLLATGGATLNGSDDDEARKYYREISMPEAKVIRPGDKWEAYKNDRPSAAWQGLMDYLTQTVCLAARIPPSVLLQIKVGGADTRRDLAVAARVFSREQARIAHQHKRIRDYIVRVKLGDNLPSGWDKVEWQFPKDITVDAGREAQQDREDMRFGNMTRREYQGRWGGDWRKHDDQVEVEARDRIDRARKLAAEKKVDFALAMQLLGTTTEVVAPVDVGATSTNSKPSVSDAESKPAVDQQDAAQMGDIQNTALNGAQLQAVQSIIEQVSARTLAPEAAKQMLRIALPLTPELQINQMVDSASSFTPARPQQTGGQP